MSIAAARAGTTAWKKKALEELRQTKALAREFHGNLGKLCSNVKAVLGSVHRGAQQLGAQYDRHLDDVDENYEKDSGAMDALQSVPDDSDQIDDVKLQAGESLEGLLSCLDELISSVQEIKP